MIALKVMNIKEAEDEEEKKGKSKNGKWEPLRVVIVEGKDQVFKGKLGSLIIAQVGIQN